MKISACYIVKDEEKKRIDAFCKENDMSVSQLIRKAIKEYMNKEK